MLPQQPVPDYLENGIMAYFAYDHRFLFIQKRYSPDKQNWLQRVIRKEMTTKPKDENFEENSYYVHKHKEVIKIDNETIKRKDDPRAKYDSLIPDTDIWIGLLRSPITTGNIQFYYNGKYTILNTTYGGFLTKYLTGLKRTLVNKTKNITNKSDVLVERWFIYPDVPANQSIFIL